MRRRILFGIGFAAFAMGMLWVGQGLGWVRWPQSSFMIDQRPWITRGSVLAVLGLVLVLYARRSRR
ncbi:hypothetical protein [uncultured Sphingomonas sp.]|uniref:hypothetical protein n=1 Tax=uncultured Sphingomonas sp. TaxID=158754 RepID=UPI0037486685